MMANDEDNGNTLQGQYMTFRAYLVNIARLVCC